MVKPFTGAKSCKSITPAGSTIEARTYDVVPAYVTSRDMTLKPGSHITYPGLNVIAPAFSPESRSSQPKLTNISKHNYLIKEE